MLAAGVCLFAFATVLLKLWWIRNAMLVCWVCGPNAYSHGMRVASGNPQRFSDGQLVPFMPNVVSGVLYFFVVALCLIVLLVLGVFACEWFRRGRNAA